MTVMMRAVLEMAAFLALSPDHVVAPDAAVAQLEQLSFLLKGLTPEERTVFLNYVAECAAAERADPARQDRADFFEQFPEDSGLVQR